MAAAPARPTSEFSREERAKELEHDYSTGRIGSGLPAATLQASPGGATTLSFLSAVSIAIGSR